MKRMLGRVALLAVLVTTSCTLLGPRLETKPSDPAFAKFQPVKAPAAPGLLLQKGDRLAIVGDSITEQKRYSRIMETYLTVCAPELAVTARQYGWSGETAEGFLKRMTNDCLRFQPTVATTCYGMNDHKYRPYDDKNAQWYREKQTGIVRAFQAAGARVVLGSPGCVGKMPGWVKTATGTVEDLNLSLCRFRNIDIEIASAEGVQFADIFWPMFTAGVAAQQKCGTNFAVAGTDGVHPGWAGQVVMAYAFLKAFGLGGEIGTFTVDLAGHQATATEGHVVNSFKDGVLTVTSRRYPFCAADETGKDSTIRGGMGLVPFNADLNRLQLVVNGATAAHYKVTWGTNAHVYAAAQLAKGVNLAEDFEVNPFSAAFKKVDDAVGVKQNYETEQIKKIFHGPEGKADMEAAVKKTEAVRAPLAAALQSAFQPVTHTLKIEAQ
jgi:lysophospholipase L1-like esterase